MTQDQVNILKPPAVEAVRADRNWHFYPGYVQGFLTPCIAGKVDIGIEIQFDSASFIDRIVEITEIHELNALKALAQDSFERSSFEPINTIARTCIAIFGAHKIPSLGEAKIIQEEAARTFRVYLPCFHPKAALDFLNWLIGVANQLSATQDPHSEIAKVHRADFKKLLQKHNYAVLQGINNMHFLRAAHALGIQIQMLDLNGTFVYGTGRYRRILKSGFTDLSPHLGVMFAQSKQMTSGLLKAAGIPTPDQYLVKDEAAAVQVVKRVGFPVVIKPNSCDGGRGVFAGLQSMESVIAAYQESRKHCSDILVERFVEGEDYRLTVHNGKVIKIIHRRAGGVMGDGLSSIAELVQKAQTTEEMRRNFRHYKKNILDLDDEAISLLSERGLQPSSIPSVGSFVPLRRKNNISSGGVQTVVPINSAHSDNLLLAERATRYLGLDLAGVDLLIPDIRVSWLDSGAHVIEVNSSPQISIFDTPDIYKEILNRSVKNSGRISLHYRVLAYQEPSPDIRRIEEERLKLGLQCSVSEFGVLVDGVKHFQHSVDLFKATRGLLLDPDIESVLVVFRHSEVQRTGFPTAFYDSLAPWSAGRSRAVIDLIADLGAPPPPGTELNSI